MAPFERACACIAVGGATADYLLDMLRKKFDVVAVPDPSGVWLAQRAILRSNPMRQPIVEWAACYEESFENARG